VNLDNVSDMYDLSDAFHAVSLRHTCILYILEHFNKICTRAGYLLMLITFDLRPIRFQVTQILTRNLGMQFSTADPACHSRAPQFPNQVTEFIKKSKSKLTGTHRLDLSPNSLTPTPSSDQSCWRSWTVTFLALSVRWYLLWVHGGRVLQINISNVTNFSKI